MIFQGTDLSRVDVEGRVERGLCLVPEKRRARSFCTRSDPVVLDGLAQHPTTRDFLGDRLGPSFLVIPEEMLAAFRQALARLGLRVDETGQ